MKVKGTQATTFVAMGASTAHAVVLRSLRSLAMTQAAGLSG